MQVPFLAGPYRHQYHTLAVFDQVMRMMSRSVGPLLPSRSISRIPRSMLAEFLCPSDPGMYSKTKQGWNHFHHLKNENYERYVCVSSD